MKTLLLAVFCLLWNTYQRVSCGLKNDAGTADVCLVFEGDGELPRLDWLTFQRPK